MALVHANRGRAVAVFGSVARGDAGPDSDVDFLVDFEPGSSLFDLLHLSDALGDLLGRRVDVVSVGGLKDRGRQNPSRGHSLVTRSDDDRLLDIREAGE